jgi:CRP-like cAMP-binding protein
MDVRELKDKASQLFSKGKFAKAAETYEEYCVADKKDHQARVRSGDAWAKAGKKDKAIAAYALAAEGFAKDGFLPRAIAASKLVLEIDPAHKGVQKMLADLYAQKSGGARPGASRPSGVMAGPSAAATSHQLEVSRSVSAPVSSFANRKDAISLDPETPLTPPKPTAAKKPPVETPSPMNRADAIELPEYELPLDQPQGEATVGGLIMKKGPNPTRRDDAIEIEIEPETASGPQDLVETSIEIELSSSVPGPALVEFEVPIEGVPLPHDELPAELQVAPPLAPAPVFEVPEAAKPAESGIYDLTDSVAAEPPRPSAPVYELTEELAEAPPPAPPGPALEVARLAAEAEVIAAERALKAAAETGDAEAAARLAAEKATAAARIAAEKAAADAAAKIAAEKAAADAAARIAVEKAAADAAARIAAEKAAVDAAAKMAAAEAVEDTATVVAPPSSSLPPPGLKPRKTDPVALPPTSRIWIPTPGSQSVPSTPTLQLDAPEAATDLEKSLEAFARFDPDAPVAPVTAPVPSAPASFTELDLDGDSLLHSVEALAAKAPTADPLAAMIEEAMDAPEDRPEPGALPKIPLFSDLPEDAFIALFEKCPLQRFDEGQLIFEQGDKADAFYVICGGTARVFRSDGGARRDVATLEEGSFFGEMALLSEAPRSASVEAGAEDTQVLAISAEILTELSARYPAVATALKKFCRQRMLSNLMNHAAIFSPFNRNDRRELVQKFRARDVKRGDVVIKEGVSSDGLYVVLSGEVEIEAAGQRIAMLKEGEVFGEMSLLTRSPASATVRAARHTSLLRLPKQDFDVLILSHPQVLEHVSVLIDERKKADLLRQGAEQMV